MSIIRKPDEMLDTILEDGQEELERGTIGLAFSGFAAGLNISFVMVALAVIGVLTDGSRLVALLFYPIGFLLVYFGRGELFTTNTVTPVVVVLKRLASVQGMLRLWALVFIFNLLGAIAFAAVIGVDADADVIGSAGDGGPIHRRMVAHIANHRTILRDDQ